jgi:hypothetical protein
MSHKGADAIVKVRRQWNRGRRIATYQLGDISELRHPDGKRIHLERCCSHRRAAPRQNFAADTATQPARTLAFAGRQSTIIGRLLVFPLLHCRNLVHEPCGTGSNALHGSDRASAETTWPRRAIRVGLTTFSQNSS